MKSLLGWRFMMYAPLRLMLMWSVMKYFAPTEKFFNV